MLDIKILPIKISPTITAVGRLGASQGEVSEAAVKKLEVPWHPLLPDQGLFSLLSWHSRVSEFAGRTEEMNQLAEWAKTDHPVWVKFVVSDGGIGKSRLGGEFAEQLQKENWSAGFVDLHHDLDFAMEEAGTLLVIDYPEERLDEVKKLLHDLTFCHPPSRLRVLFLTRQSPDKWEPIIAAANAKTIVDRNALTLTRLKTRDAKTIYDSTARGSTDYLQRYSEEGLGAGPIPEAAMEAWLKTADVNERPLFVMAAAIHSAENPDEELVNYTGRDVVKAIAEREVDRYRRIAASKELKDEYALARLLAVAAVADDISLVDIRNLLERTSLPLGFTPDDDTRNELMTAGLLIDGMVRAPKPDIVAAAFAVDILSKRADVAPEIVWEALSNDIEGGMERLGRLCWDAEIVLGIREPCLSDWLASAVENDLERCRQLELVFSEGTLPQGWIKASVAVWKTLAAHADSDERRATCLNNLSSDLWTAGDTTGALDAIEEAVEIGRRLADADPTRFDPDLAGSLNNLSNSLSDTGDAAGALDAIEETVEIRRRLAEADPARFEPDLATSLNNHSNRLSDTGDPAGALDAIKEAVEIGRRLADTDQARFEPFLAISLVNLSNRLSGTGDASGALEAIKDAEKIYRRLADADPTRFESDLATSLNNLSNRLRETGDAVGALAAIEEALDIYGRLAAADPTRFEPFLAKCLGSMGTILSSLDRRAEAAKAFAEGIRLIRPYAERFPGSPHEALLWTLQRDLNNLERG